MEEDASEFPPLSVFSHSLKLSFIVSWRAPWLTFLFPAVSYLDIFQEHVLPAHCLLCLCLYLLVIISKLFSPFHSPRAEFNKCHCTEGEGEWGGKRRRRMEEEGGRGGGRANQWWKEWEAQCVHASARVSDQYSIYTSQGVGGSEKHRLQLQTETGPRGEEEKRGLRRRESHLRTIRVEKDN